MAIALISIAVRSVRRIRLKYSHALASGAYSVSWFTLTCLDGTTADPGAVQAFLIPGIPDELELALSIDLSPGAPYRLTSAAGIPASDSSTTDPSVDDFRAPLPPQAPSPSVSSSDVLAALFSEDLRHNGTDFVEGPDGDLATIGGEQNAINAVVRSALSEGLPYNNDYGAKLRRYVDAPSSLAPAARSDVERNARRDDRVKKITSSIEPDDNSGDLTINATVTLIGGAKRSISEPIA